MKRLDYEIILLEVRQALRDKLNLYKTSQCVPLFMYKKLKRDFAIVNSLLKDFQKKVDTL